MSETKEPKEKIKKNNGINLTEEEDQIAVQHLLARNQAVRNCQAEINHILKKYEADLIVNPKSTFGNPQIIIVLKNEY